MLPQQGGIKNWETDICVVNVNSKRQPQENEGKVVKMAGIRTQGLVMLWKVAEKPSHYMSTWVHEYMRDILISTGKKDK